MDDQGITLDQVLIFGLLGLVLVLFIWGRWRHDVVAFAALIAAILAGLVPAAEAFSGFGHPAVITVALVLVLSKALQESGLIDRIVRKLAAVDGRPLLEMALLAGLGLVLSGFMNNVGALALLMPIALQANQDPARLLIPLSFGSILGGLTTLIGTPPNIIIASYREAAMGSSFGLFDFAPVGVPVALAGFAFVVLVGWRLIPRDRQGQRSAADLFDIKSYVTEARVPDDGKLVGQPVYSVERLGEGDTSVVGLLRDERRILQPLMTQRLRPGDVLILRADPTDLDEVIAEAGLELVGAEVESEALRSDDIGMIEAVIMPNARIEGRTARGLRLRNRYGVNLLALARQGRPFRERLHQVPLRAGDIMLLQGESKSLPDTVTALGGLPLAARGLSLGGRRDILLPGALFALAILATVLGLMPVYVAFGAAVTLLVVLGMINVRTIYDAVDWPVVVLLGAMIPIGGALETTGATSVLTGGLIALAADLHPAVLLVAVMVVTMTLSDLMNNAATAVVMAPIAVGIAGQLGVNADAFLMATAIGASCAFLTPIGHQNNLLIMGPGGYRFGDYWRVGLPLEVVIVALATPLLLLFWPL